MTVRAKFRCNSVEMQSLSPVEGQKYDPETRKTIPSGTYSWPRTYRFGAQ